MKQTGSNLKKVRQNNQTLLLQHIALGTAQTRAELARVTGLSKMTVTNLVADLVERGFLEEVPCAALPLPGRPPVILQPGEKAPRLCGVLIRRGVCQAVLTTLSGTVLTEESIPFSPQEMDAEKLVQILEELVRRIRLAAPDTVPAIGVASPGPVDTVRGIIRNPPDFGGISDLELVQVLKQDTGLPVWLIHDANAGALAETLYGAGRTMRSFVYLHIMNGIGAGLVLNGTLFSGDCGQSCEIGHTSIRYDGPKCSCGNRGCLDLYANLAQMRRTVREKAAEHPVSPLSALPEPEWVDFLTAAKQGDGLANAALEEFCTYLSHALVNLLNSLDIANVIVGYPAPDGCTILETLLQERLNRDVIYAEYRSPKLLHSGFGNSAPLIGAAACVAERIFSGELKIG